MADDKKSDMNNSMPPDEGHLSKEAVTYEEGDKVESNHPADPDDDIVRVTDHKAERKLCFKFDIRLLPVIAIMCMCINCSICCCASSLTPSLLW